jgi:hypothetical protein
MFHSNLAPSALLIDVAGYMMGKDVLDYIGFEVLEAVTVKNAVFWDIKTQFIPHRRQIIYDSRFTRW